MSENDDEGEDQNEEQVQVLGCWLEHIRICGPDCVAFDERSTSDPRFNPCMVLNVGRSVMVSLAGLDKAFQAGERARKNKELSDMANVEPPVVRP
jgi:hypothetical protein